MTTSVQLGGTLPEPGLDADLRIDNLLVAERSFDRVSLTANAGQTAGSYGGTVALGVEQAGELVQLKSDFSLDQPRLTLANLALSGPSTELTGGAEIDLESLLATGELGGGIGDLAALQPWTGQELRGSVDLDATFDAAGGAQDARLALFVDDLGGDFGTLRRAEIEADVTDVMGRLGVDATVTASAFAQPEPGFALADAKLRVTGDRELYTIEATAEGEMNGPFNVDAEARADVLGDARAVYLDCARRRLSGADHQADEPGRAAARERRSRHRSARPAHRRRQHPGQPQSRPGPQPGQGRPRHREPADGHAGRARRPTDAGRADRPGDPRRTAHRAGDRRLHCRGRSRS